MKCFKCNREMYQNKSEFGFYYRCPSCGRIIETYAQQRNNREWFKSRKDYIGHRSK